MISSVMLSLPILCLELWGGDGSSLKLPTSAEPYFIAQALLLHVEKYSWFVDKVYHTMQKVMVSYLLEQWLLLGVGTIWSQFDRTAQSDYSGLGWF